MFSSQEIFASTRFIADHRNGARLGVAIANNTNSAHTYRLTATINDMVETGEFMVPARRNIAKFLDELIPLPSGTVTWVEIRALDQSAFYGVGLRFTGSVFATVPLQN